jgi:hypothetical protein
MQRTRILHREQAVALDHKFGDPHQHGEEVMVERRRRGAQELAPDLDRSADPECRPHIDPWVCHDLADASLRDVQHVTDLSEAQ